jgi:hypothetical protein
MRERGAWLAAAAAALVGCAEPEAGSAVRHVTSREPQRLSDTGLYADHAARTLAPGVMAFTPSYELWSDGAEKQRWISLPPGTRIDTHQPDHWLFPVGTRVWKEFRRGGRRLETRFIERTGSGPNDYWMGAFVWDEAGRDAVFARDGASNVLGTDHDVPDARRCASCHGSEPGRILGFSAVQLAGRASPPSVATLSAQRRLSHPPAELPSLAAGAAAALGYLHANCGHCHSEQGLAFRDVDLLLRLSARTSSAEASNAYRTAVGRPMLRALGGAALRIAPGRPADSGLVERMRSREPTRQMPPLGTEHAHEAGLALLADWIGELPP